MSNKLMFRAEVEAVICFNVEASSESEALEKATKIVNDHEYDDVGGDYPDLDDGKAWIDFSRGPLVEIVDSWEEKE